MSENKSDTFANPSKKAPGSSCCAPADRTACCDEAPAPGSAEAQSTASSCCGPDAETVKASCCCC